LDGEDVRFDREAVGLDGEDVWLDREEIGSLEASAASPSMRVDGHMFIYFIFQFFPNKCHN
jgi:hypothetical protein